MKHLTRVGLFTTVTLLLYACGSNSTPTDVVAAEDPQAVVVDAASNESAVAEAAASLPTSDAQVQAQGGNYRPDIAVEKSAKGYVNKVIEYDWTLTKTVDRNEIYLKNKNDEEYLHYKLVFTKNAKDPYFSNVFVEGRSCVYNNTHYKKYVLVLDQVQRNGKGVHDPKKVFEGYIHPGKTCFDYKIEFPFKPGYKDDEFKNVVAVYVPVSKYKYGLVAYDHEKFNLKVNVNEVDEKAYLTDYLSCPEWLKCELAYSKEGKDLEPKNNIINQTFGDRHESGHVEYKVKVRLDYDKYDHDYGKNGVSVETASLGGDRYDLVGYINNWAKLTELDTRTIREAKQSVKVIVKNYKY